MELKWFSAIFVFLLSAISAPLSFGQATKEISARQWPIPEGNQYGLVEPGFRLEYYIRLEPLGDKKYTVYLEMDFQLATAIDPNPVFWYRYMKESDVFTDHQIGPEPFRSIQLSGASFEVKVYCPGQIDKKVKINSHIGHAIVGEVPNTVKASEFFVSVERLIEVHYKGTETIHKAIDSYRQEAKKKELEKQQAAKEAESKKNSQASPSDSPTGHSGSDADVDNFWTEDANENNANEEPSITLDQINANIQKTVDDHNNYWNTVNANIDRSKEMWRQNYYYAEAVRTGKQNLTDLQRLDGNYASIQQLESDFNRKYSSINTEVRNLEQARNAQVSNAVGGTFNSNPTEQAIGETMVLVGAFANSIQADKERREAQEALRLERERQVKALEEAKKKARIDLRNSFLASFPDGGTPLEAHGVSEPTVFLFAYILDKSTISLESSTVYVTNVFKVDKYSDGTFPYKTSVMSKVTGMAKGEIALVGYYTEQSKAQSMRNSLIDMANKSELKVQELELKQIETDTNINEDFWETGKRTTPAKATPKKDSFWDN